jgi:hypothetical protein
MAGRIRYAWVHFLVVPILPVHSVVHSELESRAACNNTATKNAGQRRKLDLDNANLSSSSTHWRLGYWVKHSEDSPPKTVYGIGVGFGDSHRGKTFRKFHFGVLEKHRLLHLE